MASRVGTGVVGFGDTSGNSIASAAKSTTTGNFLAVYIKWEVAATPIVTSVTDTAGNTFVEVVEASHASGDPRGALYYAENITGNASNVVTANFGSGSPEYRRIIVEEFSGIATSSSTDGSVQTNNGTGTAYSTADITTSQSGLVVLGVSGYTSLSSWSGTPGTPDFSVGATASDAGLLYLISGSAQTVTPAADAAGSDRWVAIAQAFNGAGSGGGAKKRMLAVLLAQRAMQA